MEKGGRTEGGSGGLMDGSGEGGRGEREGRGEGGKG